MGLFILGTDITEYLFKDGPFRDVPSVHHRTEEKNLPGVNILPAGATAEGAAGRLGALWAGEGRGRLQLLLPLRPLQLQQLVPLPAQECRAPFHLLRLYLSEKRVDQRNLVIRTVDCHGVLPSLPGSEGSASLER